MEITSDVIGRKMFSVECSIETDAVSRNKGSFGVKRYMYTIGPGEITETEAAPRFVDRRTDLKCACAERDKNR